MFSNTASTLAILASMASIPSTLAAPVAAAPVAPVFSSNIPTTLTAPLPANIHCLPSSRFPTSITASNIPDFVSQITSSGLSMSLTPSDPVLGANLVDNTVAVGLFYNTEDGTDHKASFAVDPAVLQAGMMAIFDKCVQSGQTSIVGGGGVSELEVEGETIVVGWVMRVGGDLSVEKDGWKSEDDAEEEDSEYEK